MVDSIRPRAGTVRAEGGIGCLALAGQQYCVVRPVFVAGANCLAELSGSATTQICVDASLQPDERFSCRDDELRELLDRLELGDNESVWAWFCFRFPKTMRKVERAGERREFVTAMRDAWELDRRSPNGLERVSP